MIEIKSRPAEDIKFLLQILTFHMTILSSTILNSIKIKFKKDNIVPTLFELTHQYYKIILILYLTIDLVS